MIRAFQWDLARQVERLDFLVAQLPRYAAWGYEELYLHLEDAVHYPSLPGIARDDAYTYEQLGELVLAAARAGIRVVPIANLLGHTQYLIKHPDLRDLNERRDARGKPLPTGQICPLHPRTREVAEKLLRDLAPYCTAGKVHVGLDESFHLGQCPRCRAEIERIGLGAHFAGHVNRLHALCRAQDLQMGMWADMLYFTPEAIPLLPAGITAYDWYYYPFARLPRVEFFNFAERDLATPLRAQGIRYYGCPMDGAFRHEPLPVFGDRLANLRSWWRRCREIEAEGFLVTSWEAYRLALETTTVVDAAAANLWLEPDASDDVALLAAGLQRALGVGQPRAPARDLLKGDAHAFAGYARWQINDRWDVFAGTEGLKACERELGFFRRMLQRAARDRWPAPLAASVAFRVYLAERDVFVRRAASDLFRLRRAIGKPAAFAVLLRDCLDRALEFRRALTAGRRAARAMWTRTRDTTRTGQNDAVLAADAERLDAWVRWLRATLRRPELARTASPVGGAWQLHFQVHNVAPAVQRVVVEEQQADGTWRELAGRHTIEFRAAAARPTTRLKRAFSVAWLTDGVTVHRAAGWREKKTLGRPAPHRGWPEFQGPQDDGGLLLRWPDLS